MIDAGTRPIQHPTPCPVSSHPPTAEQLEAEAYSLWMAGSVLLEKESDWEGALARFLRARCVCWVGVASQLWVGGWVGGQRGHWPGWLLSYPPTPTLPRTLPAPPALCPITRRKLFEELAKVGSFEQQAVCKHFLDQVDPTIR